MGDEPQAHETGIQVPSGYNLELRISGVLLMRTTVASIPRNTAETRALLAGLVAMLDAPTVPDPDVG